MTSNLFEPAAPPSYKDPSEVYDGELSKVIKNENDLAAISGDPKSDPLLIAVAGDKEGTYTGQPNPGTSKNERSADGTFVMNIAELSDLCIRGLSPQVMTGLMIQFLVSHFRDAESIINPDLRGLVWSENPKENKIRITTLAKWSVKDAGQVPAIVVSRGPMQFERIAIGDTDASYREESLFTRKVKGGYTISCVGGTPAESELLGFEVSEFLTIFSPAFRRRTPIYNIEVDQISQLVQIEEMSNKLGVQVGLHVEYPWTWSLSEQAPLMKSFTLKTSSDN